jgi:hypothetical protein
MAYPMEPITCEQLFSRHVLGFLWAKRDQLDPGQRSILDSLYKNRSKGSIQGMLKIEYRLPKTGVGRLGFGRVYGTKGSMETLERECRGTMCQEFYNDIDVVNCHPVLLCQFAQRQYQVEMPEVEKYCDNRDEYLRTIHENKEEAKQAVLKVFYNGNNEFPILAPMVLEIRNFIKKHLMKDKAYEELLAYVRKQDSNTYGSFLSHILQTEERRVMMAMRESFMKQGFSVDVLAYDGVMLRKDGREITSECLRIAESDIFQQTHYVIKLINKPFEAYDISKEQKEETDEISPKVLRTDYERTKVMFEETSFYYIPTNSIMTWDGKQLQQCSTEQAMIRFIEYDFKHSNNFLDKTSFIKLWLNDPTRRTIHTIDMKPSDDPTVFSPPLTFRFTTFEPVQNPKAVELFQELLQVICGRHEETYHYVLRWFAHLFQRPFENPKTSIFLTGKKGCGKDTLGDFMIEWLIGMTYAHNYDSTTQFWDRYDSSRENKFFIKIEEVQGALSRKYEAEFKARITSMTITVNPKGDKPRTTANYNRIFGTTNEPQPYKTDGDDERRGFTVPCSAEWCGNYDKWTEVRSTLFCASGAYAVGQWLLTVPIDDWDSRNIPKTEYMKHSANIETTSEKSFLDQWDGNECSMKELYPQYVRYCQEHDLIYAGNSKSFGMRLMEYVRDGVLKRGHSEDGRVYSKPSLNPTP